MAYTGWLSRLGVTGRAKNKMCLFCGLETQALCDYFL